jgi:hypothetical protein
VKQRRRTAKMKKETSSRGAAVAVIVGVEDHRALL